MREVCIPLLTAHVAAFAQFSVLSAGLAWDTTGFALYTAHALVGLTARVQNYSKQSQIQPINNISFIASEANFFVVVVTCTVFCQGQK